MQQGMQIVLLWAASPVVLEARREHPLAGYAGADQKETCVAYDTVGFGQQLGRIAHATMR
jgi:hypothetical protein